MVVCFEALEHTSDTATTLDELVRVLRPGGLLFVSSPNPAVYPAGNPFHLHELPPEELQHEVGRRLPHVALLRQHLMLSSLLCPESIAPHSAGSLNAAIYSVAPVQPGHDPYSLVVASTTTLPVIGSVQALAALAAGRVRKVAYVDVDAHHGTGAGAFYLDPRVLTVSIHQSPLSLAPATRPSAGTARRGARR